MYIHNINPIAFSLGNIHVYYYGLVYAIGFILTYFYLYKQIKNKTFNISFDQLDTLFIYIILGVVIGGRLGEYIFWQPQLLIQNPLSIFYIWRGGMAFHGGIIGLATALYLFTKKYKLQFYELSDRLVIPASIVLAFGRIANFINGELPGTISNSVIAVNFQGELDTAGNRIYRHPVQLYATIKNLLMAGILALEQTRNKQAGYLTWLFITIYGLFRFTVNFWREDVLWFFGILSTGQVLSFAMIVLGGFMLYNKYYKKTKQTTLHKFKKRNKK